MFVRTDIWREGKYLDLWSIPHFLSGMMIALLTHLLGFETVLAFAIAFIGTAGYELWEGWIGIEETRMNRFLDVVVGMMSFTPTFLLASMFSQMIDLSILLFVGTCDAVLTYLGWKAAQRAAVLESELRSESVKK